MRQSGQKQIRSLITAVSSRSGGGSLRGRAGTCSHSSTTPHGRHEPTAPGVGAYPAKTGASATNIFYRGRDAGQRKGLFSLCRNSFFDSRDVTSAGKLHISIWNVCFAYRDREDWELLDLFNELAFQLICAAKDSPGRQPCEGCSGVRSTRAIESRVRRHRFQRVGESARFGLRRLQEWRGTSPFEDVLL